MTPPIFVRSCILALENEEFAREALFVSKDMLNDTKCSLEAILILTHNYKTSRSMHHEDILKREYEKATKINYGLKNLPDTVHHIANDEYIQWFLLHELKTIKDGLTYA